MTAVSRHTSVYASELMPELGDHLHWESNHLMLGCFDTKVSVLGSHNNYCSISIGYRHSWHICAHMRGRKFKFVTRNFTPSIQYNATSEALCSVTWRTSAQQVQLSSEHKTQVSQVSMFQPVEKEQIIGGCGGCWLAATCGIKQSGFWYALELT